MRLLVRCVLMCALGVGCAKVAAPLGAGDVAVDDAAARAEAAQRAAQKAAEARKARDARWLKLAQSLRHDDAKTLWERAREQEKSQNWKEAEQAYQALVVFFPRDENAPRAVERAAAMAFRLGGYGEGFLFFEDALDAYDGDPVVRARLMRVLAATYLAVPHWGTTRGGEYLRGRYDQGKQTQTYADDRAQAVTLLEGARDLLASAPSAQQAERAAVDVDLALAVARFTGFDATWNWWWTPDTGKNDGLADGEGDDEHADDWQRSSWSWALQRARPRGLPVSPQGEVLFAQKPTAYAPGLDDTEKIKFLLDEAQRLDDGKDKEIAGQALLQQALLFRTRDGAERLDRLRSWWFDGGYPYRDAAKDEELAKLGDDEVVTLVATSVRKVTVPADESVPRLLRAVQERYPKSKAADEAEALLGSYYQSREQYEQAVAVDEKYLRDHQKGEHAGEVRGALELMRRPEAVFQAKGSQAAGKPASVSLRFRNLDALHFTARRIDAERVERDFEKDWVNGPHRNGDREIEPSNLGWAFVEPGSGYDVKPYLTKDEIEFDADVKPDEAMHYRDADVKTPVEKAGVWLVEARPRGAKKASEPLSRTILVVDKAAVVVKRTADGDIAWVVDARTGKPEAGAHVDVFFYGSRWEKNREIRRSKKASLVADAHGVARLPGNDEMTALVSARADGTFTMPVQQWLGDRYSRATSAENAVLAVVVTDRPVYRPGDTVHAKVWARRKVDGAYLPAAGVKHIGVRVYDSRSQEVTATDDAASSFGSISFDLPLKKGAPLGSYRVDVTVDGGWADTGNARFQVEEYKTPEVLVSVKAAGQARLGDKIDVAIHADYYAGGPVNGAKVRYKVFRSEHEVSYAAPSEWDWLYGAGYGRIWYPYPWFTWWDDIGPRPIFWYPWWGPKPDAPKELVQEGEGVTGKDGVLAVTVDTAAAKRDHGDEDHQYTIEAEVTDLSRHVVKGSGSVAVTRSAFQASLEVQAGWARPGDDVNLAIATLLPDGSLFPAKGALRVEEILGVADNGAVRGEKLVEEKPLVTDDKGPTRVRWRAPKTGQYRFTFVAKDKDGADVKASAVAWVVGPDFVGEHYRFAGVEIVPDKRTYRVGDVARLLVSADRAGASVLLATKVDAGALLDWKVIELPHKTTIVELPITKESVPNFFVEASTVADGQLFQDAREVYVPPEGSELHVEVKPAKRELDPGAKGDVVVTTTDGEGRPVSAEVALSVFDSSVLAIMPDSTVDVRKHLWGRKRSHSPSATSSLGRASAVWGSLASPDQQARWQLASRSQRRFQGAIDFVNDQEAQNRLGGVAGLAQNGVGPGGGGGFAAGSLAAEGEAAAAPMMKTALAHRSAAREGEDERDDAPKDASKKADAPAASSPVSRGPGGAAQGGPAAPHVRTSFADTALFTSVVTDANGTAHVTVPFPENLTTWKVRAVGLDAGARAGRGDASMITTKKLLVRLAAPRFFRDRDDVVLSAIVQNKHPKAEHTAISIDVTDDLLAVDGAKSRTVDIAPGGEARVDFRVKVHGEGEAKVRVTARGDDDGDAKELSFPVLIHGMEKTVAATGSIAAGSGTAEKSIVVEVPAKRREDQTELVVRTSPSLAGGMIDALPYLLDYPYGCVEQTLSRFVPAVLTRKALQQAGGVTLEELAKAHRDLNAQHLGKTGDVDQARAERENKRWERNPIYDSKLLQQIIDEGLARIAKMQHGDGGWGWWSDDESSGYMTALVLAGLLDAKDADLALDAGMLARGSQALNGQIEGAMWRYRDKDMPKYVSDADAYALWVSSRFGDRHDELMKDLYERRFGLSPYGKLLLAIAEKNLGQEANAGLLLENVDQLVKSDAEDETAHVETATNGWWYWWNDDIETNALYLRALDAIRPQDKTAPMVVKWLLNHRKHGWYWDSTRDTAMVVAAFANHMQVSGERRPDFDLTISVDGVAKKAVHVDAKNMFTVDTDLRLEGKELGGGKHTITIKKSGDGAVYFNTYLSFFTLEDDIKAAGLEVKVDRKYYKLVQHDRVHDVAGARGQSLAEKELAYEKVPLASGDDVKSGDLILVELTVTSKNDYTYLAFEDPKPAGAEAVALRSGTVGGEAWAHMELRDDRVVFFLSELTQGKLTLSYRLRAELPGRFSAMPTKAFAMYAPEIRANSGEMKLRIDE